MYLSRVSQLSVPHPKDASETSRSSYRLLRFQILGGDKPRAACSANPPRHIAVTSPSCRSCLLERPMPMKVPILRSGELLDRSEFSRLLFWRPQGKVEEAKYCAARHIHRYPSGDKQHASKPPTGVNGEKARYSCGVCLRARRRHGGSDNGSIRSRLSGAPPAAVVRTIQPQSAVASESMPRLQ